MAVIVFSNTHVPSCFLKIIIATSLRKKAFYIFLHKIRLPSDTFNTFITLIFNLKTQDLPVTHSHCDSKSLSEAPIQNPVFSICCDVRTCCRKVWRLSFLIWIRSPPSLRHRFRATSQSNFSKLNWRHSWSKVARFSGKSELGQPTGLWINAADAIQIYFQKYDI